jgi:hypothetical protein
VTILIGRRPPSGRQRRRGLVRRPRWCSGAPRSSAFGFQLVPRVPGSAARRPCSFHLAASGSAAEGLTGCARVNCAPPAARDMPAHGEPPRSRIPAARAGKNLAPALAPHPD